MIRMIVVMLMVFVCSLGVSAQVSVDVLGGMLISANYSLDGAVVPISADATGINGSIMADFGGPLGARINVVSLRSGTYNSYFDKGVQPVMLATAPSDNVTNKLTKLDFLGSYTWQLPVLEVRALVGYSKTTSEIELPFAKQILEYGGFLLGVEAEYALLEKTTLKAGVGYGVGVKCDLEMIDDGASYGTESADGSMLEYTVAAKYEVVPNVCIEFGYTATELTFDGSYQDDPVEGGEKISGLFLGARAGF